VITVDSVSYTVPEGLPDSESGLESVGEDPSKLGVVPLECDGRGGADGVGETLTVVFGHHGDQLFEDVVGDRDRVTDPTLLCSPQRGRSLKLGWGFDVVVALGWRDGASCAPRLPDALRGRDTHQLGPGDCGPYCARRMPTQHYHSRVSTPVISNRAPLSSLSRTLP